MKDQHPAAPAPPGAAQPVIVVGAGPVGAATALLLADSGIPVTLLERRLQPHPLPRAVHLDDEVTRILHRLGVSEAFLARSRPGSGLRLLDARHQVMAEFGREETGLHGYPQANMFHQPDLEELLLARVAQHPLISSYWIRISAGPDPAPVQAGADWTEARLAGGEPLAVRHAFTADPALAVVVRPDRVVAAVAPGRALPRLPWAVPPGPHPLSPGSAAPGQPGTAAPHSRSGQAVPPGP